MPMYNTGPEETENIFRSDYRPVDDSPELGYAPMVAGGSLGALSSLIARATKPAGVKMSKTRIGTASTIPALLGLAGRFGVEDPIREVTGEKEGEKIFGSDFAKGVAIGEGVGFSPELANIVKSAWRKIPAGVKKSPTARGIAGVVGAGAALWALLKGRDALLESMYKEPEGD